jgi:hypothetical protein
MTDVTISLSSELAERAQARASLAGMSLSLWIIGVIQLELGDRPEGSTLRDTLYRGDWPRELLSDNQPTPK